MTALEAVTQRPRVNAANDSLLKRHAGIIQLADARWLGGRLKGGHGEGMVSCVDHSPYFNPSFCAR